MSCQTYIEKFKKSLEYTMTFYNIAQVIIDIEKFKENLEDTRVFHNIHT